MFLLTQVRRIKRWGIGVFIFLSILLLPHMSFATGSDISVTSTSGAPGSSVSVSVIADFSVGVDSMEFTLPFDPKLLNVTSVTAGSATSGWTVVSNPNNTAGTLGVAMFTNGGPVSGTQRQVLVINFTVVNPPGDSATSDTWVLNNVDFDAATNIPQIDTTNAFTLTGSSVNYNLNINESGNGSVTESVGGVTTTATSFPSGTVVQLTAAPTGSYKFSDWTGDVSSSSNPLTLTMNANMNVLANFVPIPTVTMTSPVNDASYYSVQSIPLVATASETNGTIANVKFYNNGTTLIGTGTLSAGNTYSYTWSGVAAGSYTVTAIATDSNGNSTTSSPVSVQMIQEYGLTVSTTGGGSILCGYSGNLPVTCPSNIIGGTTYFEATGPAGTVLSSWGGACAGIGATTPNSGTTNTYQCVLNINSTTNVSATFALATYTITPSTGANGSISPSTAVTVSYGASKIFTFTPNTGYSSYVSVDGATAVALPSNSYTFTDVVASHTIAASFSATPLTPDGTTLSPGSTSSLVTTSGTWTFGTGTTILLNGKQVTGGVANLLLVYNGGKLYDEYSSIWYLWNGSGWTTLGGDPRIPLTPDGTILTQGSTGSLVTASGTWTFGGGTTILLNGKQVTGGVANQLLVYNQGKLYDEYDAIWYLWNGSGWTTLSGDPRGVVNETINASTGSNGTISPSGAVSVSYGANQSFTFAPATGYSSYVSVDGATAVALPSNSYTFTDVTAAHTIAASFKTITLTPDGTTLSPGSSSSLVTTSGTWTFGSGTTILLNGKQVTGGAANLLLVYNNGQLYAEYSSIWYLWNGSGWTTLTHDPRTPLTADGTTLSPGSSSSLVTTSGVWTFGSGTTILLNGKQVTGGVANLLLVYNGGKLYDEYSSIWYLWNGSGWTTLTTDPRNPSTETINASTGSNGTISPSGAVSVSYGANQTFTFAPATGYSSYVSVDGATAVALPSNSYTFTDVTAAHTIAASFKTITLTPDGTTLSPGSSSSLVTTSGTWTFGSGTTILLNGNHVTGGTANLLLVYNGGQLYAEYSSIWYLWNGSGWTTLSRDPRVSLSPDGDTLSPGSSESLITTSGTWTFGSGDTILLNGNHVTGGTATLLLVYNGGKLYAYYNSWYLWNGSGWTTLGGDPRTPLTTDGTTLSPGSTASLITTSGTWTFGTGTTILLNGNHVTGGVANLLLVYNGGQLYAEYSSIWYLWDNPGWTTLSGDPRTSQSSRVTAGTKTVSLMK